MRVGIYLAGIFRGTKGRQAKGSPKEGLVEDALELAQCRFART